MHMPRSQGADEGRDPGCAVRKLRLQRLRFQRLRGISYIRGMLGIWQYHLMQGVTGSLGSTAWMCMSGRPGGRLNEQEVVDVREQSTDGLIGPEDGLYQVTGLARP